MKLSYILQAALVVNVCCVWFFLRPTPETGDAAGMEIDFPMPDAENGEAANRAPQEIDAELQLVVSLVEAEESREVSEVIEGFTIEKTVDGVKTDEGNGWKSVKLRRLNGMYAFPSLSKINKITMYTGTGIGMYGNQQVNDFNVYFTNETEPNLLKGIWYPVQDAFYVNNVFGGLIEGNHFIMTGQWVVSIGFQTVDATAIRFFMIRSSERMDHKIVHEIEFFLQDGLTKPDEFKWEHRRKENVLWSYLLDEKENTSGNVVCPCCGYHGDRFVDPVTHLQDDGFCPAGKCWERHRLACYMIDTHEQIQRTFKERQDRKPKILHFGPDARMRKWIDRWPLIEQIAVDYKAYGYQNFYDDVYEIDAQNIKFPDNFFAGVMSFHVIEHVIQDVQAISEVYRVLEPGGWALLEVPCFLHEHRDCTNMTTKEEKTEHCSQWDHFRHYSIESWESLLKRGAPDFQCHPALDFVSDEVEEKIRVSWAECQHVCLKPVK